MKMKVLASLLLLVGFVGLAKADIVLTGSSVEYTGAGQYSFEYYATADADHAIEAVTLPIEFAPGVSYESDYSTDAFAQDNVFPNIFPNTDGFLSDDGVFNIANGETKLLFSYVLNLDLNVGDLPVDVAAPVNTGALAGFFELFGTTNGSTNKAAITVTQITPNTAIAPTVNAVPEPTSALLLVGGGLGLGALGLRRKARKAATTEEAQG